MRFSIIAALIVVAATAKRANKNKKDKDAPVVFSSKKIHKQFDINNDGTVTEKEA